MILHCVFCSFRDDVSPALRSQIFRELSTFSQTLDGVIAFDSGPNRDFEGKSQEYSDGFVIRFVDRNALERYAAHPKHLELGRRLCGLCNGGPDGIVVFDLDAL